MVEVLKFSHSRLAICFAEFGSRNPDFLIWDEEPLPPAECRWPTVQLRPLDDHQSAQGLCTIMCIAALVTTHLVSIRLGPYVTTCGANGCRASALHITGAASGCPSSVGPDDPAAARVAASRARYCPWSRPTCIGLWHNALLGLLQGQAQCCCQPLAVGQALWCLAAGP